MTTHGETLTTARPKVGRASGLRDRPVLLVGLGIAALVVALILGVGVGSVGIEPADTLKILAHRFLGLDIPRTWSDATETIVVELRLPRILTAMLVGCALAVAGATFQGLLRNPLADPYVLGTASGAALGAAIAVLIPVRFVILEFGLLQAFAFIGALAAITAVYKLSRIGGLSPLTSLLLTGYAVGSLLAAGLAMAMYLSGAALRQIFTYLLGSFDAATWPRFLATLPIILIASIAIMLRARSLNGLLLGEQAAAHLGIDVRRERRLLLALASLVTAAAVAISGLIGFVGLVVPHVVRLLVGPSARLVLPLSAIGGAALLAYADILARLAGGIPVGVVTAIIGAPFFLLILRRARTGYEV
jgi:iron complex transport system permease protein